MAEAEDSKKPNGNALLKHGEIKSSTSDAAEVKKESAGSISLKEAAEVGAENATEPVTRVINSDESSTAALPTGEKNENDKSASERDFNRFPEKVSNFCPSIAGSQTKFYLILFVALSAVKDFGFGGIRRYIFVVTVWKLIRYSQTLRSYQPCSNQTFGCERGYEI
jgi:hypothetical protein